MAKYGKESKAVKRAATAANGGTLKGRDARKAAQQGGVDNGVVNNSQGKIVASFKGRTRRQPNEHGV